MSSANNLEINGVLSEHSLAELLIEIAQTRLNGSLRLSRETQKTVVYFDAGEVVFAVSNERAFRLFEMILREKKITQQQLSKIADFTNDFLLGRNLLKNDLFSKPEVDRMFVGQIEQILKNACNWREGEWIFSPLVRIKGEIRYKVRLNESLIEHARCLSDDAIAGKFKNLKEIISVKPTMPAQINLSPQESFVFSRFEAAGLSVEDLKTVSGMSDVETLKILYTLWLGGFLNRQNQNSAFSDRQTSEILSANLSLIKNQNSLEFQESTSPKNESATVSNATISAEKNESVEAEVSLDEYLARVESAGNYYEILSVEPQSSQTEIKQAYFSMAKRFHPDLFHKEADTQLQQRVQQSFSQLAQAYDTLRHEKNREVYNFKMRKALELKEKRPKTNVETETDTNANARNQREQASDSFEQGFSFLMEQQIEAATPYLARAAHFADDNARFRAYYGKALSFDNAQRHKAEAELQAAVALDPTNPDFRIMLAEFFVQVGLLKRAQGELNRLLAVFPSNREAKVLLDSLPKK